MGERVPGNSRRRTVVLVLVALLIGAAIYGSLMGDGLREPATAAAPPAAADDAASSPSRAAKQPHRARAEQATDEDVDVIIPDAHDPAPLREETHRTLRVVVVEAGSGAPIGDARVRAYEMTFDDEPRVVRGTTGADGVATLDLTAFCSTVAAEKTGWIPGVLERVGKSNEARIELRPGVPIRGRVVMSGTRAPAAGVSVRAFAGAGGLDGPIGFATTTGADGRFEMCGIESGTRTRIFAVAKAFAWADAIVEVTPTLGDVEIVLGRGGVLEGTVLDAKNQPVDGADVYVIPEGGPTPDPRWAEEDEFGRYDALRGFIFVPVRTAADGRFEFRGVVLPRPGVQASRVVVARTADAREARSQPVTFSGDGERQTRNVTFAKDGRIVVRVKSSPPLADAKVRVQRNGPNGTDETRDLPKDGSPVTFDGLPAMGYFVSVSVGDWRRDHWEDSRFLTLSPGEERVVEFALGKRMTLTGRVQDPAGHGIARQRIAFGQRSGEQGGTVRAETVSGADGSFEFRLLASESGTLAVRPDDFDDPFGRGERPPRFEPREIEGVRPGGDPVIVILRGLGRLTGRVRWAPPEQAPHMDENGLLRRASGGSEVLQVTVTTRAGRDLAASNFGSIDANGRFACDAPVVGVAAELSFGCDDWAPVFVRIAALASGETHDVGEIVFTRGTTFEPRFVGADGAPLVGAEVRALDPWMHIAAPVTGASGGVRFDRVPAHPLVLRAAATAATPVAIVVADPSKTPATFTIGPGALVEGKVVDADGKPVPGANVVWHPGLDLTDHEDAYGLVDADAAGRFSFRLQAGRASVKAYDPKGRQRVNGVELTVTDGETRTLDLVVR